MKQSEIRLDQYLANVMSQSGEYNHERNHELVRQYVEYMVRVRNRTTSTVRTYDSLLVMWADHLEGQPILKATKQDMERFVQRPRIRRGAGTTGAAASRKRDADILRSFYRWAHEEGLTSSFQALSLHGPTVRNTNPRPIPDADWLRLWGAEMEDSDRVMLGFGFFLGLRRSELCALRVDQVTDTHIVNFIRKGGGESTLGWRAVLTIYERHFPNLVVDVASLTGPLARLTTGHGNGGESRHLLPFRGNGSNMAKRLIKLQDRVGVSRFTPHQLRHSAATNMLRAGVPIHIAKEIMNHSDISITMRYVRAGDGALREWLGST